MYMDPTLVKQLKAVFIEDMSYKNTMPDKCPKCRSERIIKNGYTKTRVQRYKCGFCQKTFTGDSILADDKTRKDPFIWNLFVDCMLSRTSVRKAATICGITNDTSFRWRNKLFDTVMIIYKNRLEEIEENLPALDERFVEGSKNHEIFETDYIPDEYQLGPKRIYRKNVGKWIGVYEQNLKRYRAWERFMADAYASGYKQNEIVQKALLREREG